MKKTTGQGEIYEILTLLLSHLSPHNIYRPSHTCKHDTMTLDRRLIEMSHHAVMSIHSVKMDVDINSTIQYLLRNDSGHYDDYLFGLGEKVLDNQTENEDDNHLSEESDDESMRAEVCPICRKTCISPNKDARDHIKRCQTSLKASGVLVSYGVFSTPFSLLVRHSHYRYVRYAVQYVRYAYRYYRLDVYSSRSLY